MTSPIAGEQEAPWRCIKPHCALNCDGCNHAIRNVPGPRMLVLELLDTFASDYEDGDSKLVDKARAFICEPEAALLEPVGEGWVSVEERLPAPGKPVLAFYKNSHGLGRTTRAHHSPKHTVDASTWEDGSDDTECGSYEPEGWWEDPTEAEALAFICHDVTHWMPLPSSPKSNGGMGS